MFRSIALFGSLTHCIEKLLTGFSPGICASFNSFFVSMLAVVGGWWALWPHRLRVYATLALIGSLIVLNSVAAGTIVSFYRSIPLG